MNGVTTLRTFFLLFLLLLCPACGGGGGGGDDDGSDSDDDAPAEESEDPPANADRLNITTFNVGLLPDLVPLTEERVRVVAEAVAGHDADVICLQEIWQEADLNRILGRISSTYPHLAAVPSRQKFATNLPVCTVSDLEPTLDCVLSNCVFTSAGLFECLLSTCSAQINALGNSNPQCAQAVTAQAGRSGSDIVEIQEILFSDEEPAGLFAFGGSSGLLLASKIPLENVETVDFFDISTSSRRAALLATVTRNGVRHRVGCTHLQSNFEGLLPYTGDQGSWAGEHRAQAERFVAAAEHYSGSDPQYLAGDYNCSLASGSVLGELESGCRVFISNGYADPAAGIGACSYCSSNLLNQAAGAIVEGEDTLLDHVFMKRTFFSGTTADLVFQSPVGAGGQTTNLSDHYGVRVGIAVP